MIRLIVKEDTTVSIDKHNASYKKGDVFEIENHQLPEYAPYIHYGIFAIEPEKIINKKQNKEVVNDDN